MYQLVAKSLFFHAELQANIDLKKIIMQKVNF